MIPRNSSLHLNRLGPDVIEDWRLRILDIKIGSVWFCCFWYRRPPCFKLALNLKFNPPPMAWAWLHVWQWESWTEEVFRVAEP